MDEHVMYMYSLFLEHLLELRAAGHYHHSQQAWALVCASDDWL